MKTLITRGHVIDPANGLHEKKDILIVDGKIKEILSSGSKVAGATIIDADGLMVTPGFVDLHTHLREPGQEYKETIATGAKAAVAGGYTSICAMANTNPVNDQASITVSIKQKAKEAGLAHLYPVGALTKGLKGEQLAAIGDLWKAGCVAVSDDGLCVGNSQVMRTAMAYAKTFGLPVLTHAVDPWLQAGTAMNEGSLSNRLGISGEPSQAEDIMIARDIYLAELTGVHLHVCHVSTKEGVALIRRAKAKGLTVTAEVTPHHLILTEALVDGYNTNAKMNPPLRTEADRQALIGGLVDGTIDAIATDHAPHTELDKEVEFDQAACGVIGLESAFGMVCRLLINKEISLERIIEALTIKPARVVGINAGTLSEGAPADITIFDPRAKFILEEKHYHSKSLNSPFLGMEMQARIIKTFVYGKIVYSAEEGS